MRDVRHTRFGWWLEEAGPIDPRPPLEGDTRADVVVVGGGYLGLWTAWQLKALEPECDVVVLEAGLAGHGPSGRNGGFVSSLWDDLPILRDRLGDTAAVAVARASERPLDGIEEWCARRGSTPGSGVLRRSMWRPRRHRSAPRTTRSPPAPRSAHGGARPDLGRRARGSLLCRLPRRGDRAALRDRPAGTARARAPRRRRPRRRSAPRAQPVRRVTSDASLRRRRADASAPDRSCWQPGARPPASPASGSRTPSPRATSCSPSPSRTSLPSSAGRAASRSATAKRSCTTCARPATAASPSAGVAAGWASARDRSNGSSSTAV